MFAIRLAVDSDRPRLLELCQAFAREWRGIDGLPAPTVDLGSVLDEVFARGVILVAETDRVVGFFGLIVAPHRYFGDVTGFEVGWYLEPASRGGPIAVRLLRAAEAEARARGAVQFEVGTPDPEPRAALLRLGYRPRETTYVRRW